MDIKKKLEIKIVIVGDGAVGKTCSLISFSENEFPKRYVPTVFDNFTANVCVDNYPIMLTLWDTAGQEDYDELRPLSYPGSDFFIFMFSVISKISLENIKHKWIPEVQTYCPNTPFCIVCSKIDLRDDPKYNNNGKINFIRSETGRQFARDVGANGYKEISALTQQNLHECFHDIVRYFIPKTKNTNRIKNTNEIKNKRKKYNKCCIII